MDSIRNNYLNNLFSLAGKTALITGASSGIGRHLAHVYAKAGANVIVLARREQNLAELAESIKNDGTAVEYITADLLAYDDFKALADQISKPLGPPDILVNAAGINLRQAADDVTQEGWEKTLRLNLSVPFYMAQALAPVMCDKGYGRIINIASLQSFRAFENGIAYGASKGGVAQLTRAMAQAWSSHGVTCNAIAPGFFPTELTAAVFDNEHVNQHHAQATAIGRNGQMHDLDGTVVFLAAHASAYVTGQIIAVDGGYLAK